MSNSSDEKLLRDHLAGHPDAFRVLVERHSRELYEFVFRFTRSSAAAEDVVQEAFLQVHLSGSSFDPARRFRPWLFTIAANKSRDWLRSRARRREVALDATISSTDEVGQRFLDLLADESAGPGERMELDEKRQAVQRVVDRMPPALGAVLVLAYYHRFPYKEMAEILGIPLGTVKSRLHAAVAAFGRAFREESRKGMNLDG